MPLDLKTSTLNLTACFGQSQELLEISALNQSPCGLVSVGGPELLAWKHEYAKQGRRLPVVVMQEFPPEEIATLGACSIEVAPDRAQVRGARSAFPLPASVCEIGLPVIPEEMLRPLPDLGHFLILNRETDRIVSHSTGYFSAASDMIGAAAGLEDGQTFAVRGSQCSFSRLEVVTRAMALVGSPSFAVTPLGLVLKGKEWTALCLPMPETEAPDALSLLDHSHGDALHLRLQGVPSGLPHSIPESATARLALHEKLVIRMDEEAGGGEIHIPVDHPPMSDMPEWTVSAHYLMRTLRHFGDCQFHAPRKPFLPLGFQKGGSWLWLISGA